jgi:FMN reductase
MTIRIATVLGTVRPGNKTSWALELVNDELRNNPNVELDFIDPAKLELGFPGQPSPDKDALQQRIGEATGVILSTPEYHGSYASALKQVIENLGFPSALKGKPVALLGVAGGVIGAIKSLEHLRSVCSHLGALVLPGPVSVARVGKAFDEQGNCIDAATEKRLRGLAGLTIEYINNHICPQLSLERTVRGESA